MDFLVRFTFGYCQQDSFSISMRAKEPCWGTLLQTSNPIPQWFQIAIVDSQFPNVFIKLNGMAQVLFRLFHASLDAGVAGQCERNHGNVGMYRLRPKQNDFGLRVNLLHGRQEMGLS
jgi:hypothetical protein